MAKKSQSVRTAEAVTFDFWSTEVNTELLGKVIDRGAELIIDIPYQKAQGPYLIKGKKKGQIFSGCNSSSDPDAPEVEAEWCEFSEQYAGVWVENGYEMLFCFRLPR